MQIYKYNKITKYIIMAFLAIIGIEFYIYGSNTVLVGYEAAYCYVLDW